MLRQVKAGGGQQRYAVGQSEQALAHQYLRLFEGVAMPPRQDFEDGARFLRTACRQRVGRSCGSQHERKPQAGDKVFHVPPPPIIPPTGELGVAA